MNLQDTPEMAAFREEVQVWIANDVPAHLKKRRQGIVQGPGISHEDTRLLMRALEKKHWLAPAWPKKYGGAGFSFQQLVVFYDECDRGGVPDFRTTGMIMLGPVLIRYGTEAQKKRFLKPIMYHEELWSQGYSEPDAGSDLASLQLRAEIYEDHFLLNGQKIWTSKAHEAHWIFLLARSDSQAKRKQEGISFLLVERNSPGIEVRPIRTLDGFHHFNETFYENVKVPRKNLVGELHKGWEVAKALLGHERFTHPTANPLVMTNALAELKSSARKTPYGHGVMWDDKRILHRITQLEMDASCLYYTRLRALSKVNKGEAPGPETMIFKQFGAELNQRIIELQQEIEGMEGCVWDVDWQTSRRGETARHACNIRAATLRGGTSEVQRNIVAKRVLGLP